MENLNRNEVALQDVTPSQESQVVLNLHSELNVLRKSYDALERSAKEFQRSQEYYVSTWRDSIVKQIQEFESITGQRIGMFITEELKDDYDFRQSIVMDIDNDIYDSDFEDVVECVPDINTWSGKIEIEFEKAVDNTEKQSTIEKIVNLTIDAVIMTLEGRNNG